MSIEVKDAVTSQTCKLITDAQYANVKAVQTLLEAKIQAIKNTIYVCSLTLGLVLTAVQIVLNYLHH